MCPGRTVSWCVALRMIVRLKYPPFFFNIIAILFSTDTTLALVLSPKHWDRYGVGSGMLYGHVLAPPLLRK